MRRRLPERILSKLDFEFLEKSIEKEEISREDSEQSLMGIAFKFNGSTPILLGNGDVTKYIRRKSVI